MFKTGILVIASAIVALASAKFGAASFECEKVWSNVSADNSVATCVSDPGHLVNLLRDPVRFQYGGGIVLAIMLLALTMMCFPFITVCRYVCRCFGGCTRRPGAFFGGSEWDEVPEEVKQKGYDERGRKVAVWAPWVLLVLCIAPMVILIAGGAKAEEAYNGIFDDARKLATYMEDKLNKIREGMKDPADPTKLISPLNEQYFYDGGNKTVQLRNELKSTQDKYKSYVKMAKDIAIAFGCVPMLFFAFNALFSFFKIRRVLPLINNIFLFLLVIVYGVIALILLSIALVMRDACDEITVYVNGRRPGIFSWYVSPLCKKNTPFDTFKKQIDTAESTAANAACTNLIGACNSASNTYSGATPAIIFYCPGLTAASLCTNFSTTSGFVNVTTLLPAANPVTCTASPCYLRDCQTKCSTAGAKATTTTIINKMDAAYASRQAYDNHVAPILDCDNVLTIVLKVLVSCSTLQEALWLIGCGSFLFEIYSVGAITMVWAGQKRWFDGEGSPPEELYPSDANEPTSGKKLR